MLEVCGLNPSAFRATSGATLARPASHDTRQQLGHATPTRARGANRHERREWQRQLRARFLGWFDAPRLHDLPSRLARASSMRTSNHLPAKSNTVGSCSTAVETSSMPASVERNPPSLALAAASCVAAATL